MTPSIFHAFAGVQGPKGGKGTDKPPFGLEKDPPINRVRIRRLGPLLAARRIRLQANCPSTKLLRDQLRDFRLAEHNDGPDALEMALRLAGDLLAGPHNDGLGNRLPINLD